MKVHYFNPGHETAVLNGSPYYMAPANVVAMQRDLAFLPAWYGCAEDVVLVDDNSEIYYSYLTGIFHGLPKAVSEQHLTGYRNAEVSLWGVSPQGIHYFEELNRTYGLQLEIPQWDSNYLYLNSRKAAHDCLSELCGQISDISKAIIPRFFDNLDDIKLAVYDSEYQLLAKAPFSSSGRGLLWLPQSGLTRTESQILHGILKKQGSVSVERVLDKQVDFAMEFMSDGKGGIDFAGYSLFYTNSKGGYESNYIGSQQNIEQQLYDKIPPSLLTKVRESLKVVLAGKYGSIYSGCIGVDMLIYEDDGELRLHPCVEINMRYNMGYLALNLYRNYIMSGAEGRFYLDFTPQAGRMYENHMKMLDEHPPVYIDGKLGKGYLSLCPVTSNTHYRAFILIG